MLNPVAGATRHAALLGAVLLTSAVISGLVVATSGLLDRHAVEGVRAEFAGRSGDERALRLSLPLAGDAEAQNAGVRRALELDFARVDASLAVDRVVEGRVELTTGADVAPVLAEAISVEGFAERAELVAGDWSDASGLTMQADAADALGLEPGADVQLDGETFELTGTWRIVDRLDARWTDPQLMAAGAAGDRSAVVVLEEASWQRLAAEPQATWSIEPSIRDLSISDVSAIPPIWSRLSGSLRDALGSLEGLERDSDFVRTAEEIGARVAGLDAVEPVVLLLLGALGLATLAQLARLLALERQEETRLIWSRGASTLELVARVGVEALVVALVGAALGTGGAIALLAVTGDPTPQPTLAEVVLPAGAVAVTAALFAAVRMWALVRRLETDRVGASSRFAGTTRLGLVALVTAAAALSTWQLLLYGSPLTPDARGELSVDPITVASPALVVIAGVLIAAAIAPLAARLLDRPRRSTPVASVLAVASVARRPEIATASVVTGALAVASIVLAAGYSGTWALAFDRSAASRAAAAATALSPDAIESATITAIAQSPQISGVAPLLIEDVQLDDEAVALIGAAPDAVRLLVEPAALADAEAIADAIRIDVPGPELPEGTAALTLSAAATGFATPPTITLLVSDALGVLTAFPLTAATGAQPGAVAYAATMPDALLAAPGPLQVLAIEAEIAAGAVAPGVGATWELLALEATTDAGATPTAIELEPFWGPVSPVPQQPAPEVTPEGRGFIVDALARSIRLTPPLDSAADIPVVISEAVAERSRLGVGDAIRIRGVGSVSLLRGVVAAIVEAVPSAPVARAVLIDLDVVRNAQLVAPAALPPTSALWLSGDDALAAGETARLALPAGTRIDDAIEAPTRDALAGAVTALWLAAAGATALALVTVAASARAQRRGRLGEVAILRALGLRARQQAGIRAVELALTASAGVVAGLLAGAAVVLVAVAPFARAAVPVGAPVIATPVAIEVVLGCSALAALVLGLTAIVLATAARVRRDARTAGSGELER